MQRLVKIITTPSARSAAVYYFGNFAINIGRYLFHLLLLRLLLPADYGEFLAYLSLLYLLGIPNTTIANIVTKYVAEFKGRGNDKAVNQFFYYLLGRLTPVTLATGLALIIFSGPLATTFKAHPAAFVILGLSVFVGLLSTMARSFLNAFQRFTAQITIGGIEIISTILIAFILIRLGLSATGAVTAQLMAGIIGTLLVFLLIRNSIIPKDRGKKISFTIRNFGGYSLIYAIGSLSLISTDVLLVRYFMSEHLSGIYSSLSILGRMIFFGLSPLIALVLPIATHRHAATKQSRGVLVKLGAVIIMFGLSAAGLFSFFPGQTVALLSGANYLEAANYLPAFSFGMLFFSLNLFLVSYFMAIGKPRINLYLLLATLAQPLLIIFFHQSLDQIVWLNLVLETGLLATLIWQLFPLFFGKII